MNKTGLVFGLVVILLGALLAPAAAQDDDHLLAPPEIRGEAIYVPFPVAITLDGALDDWAGVPVEVVDRGTATSRDPAENGSFTVAVAANEDTIFIQMQMADATIVTGQHGTDFWNEDSLEFYFNFTDDVFATQYSEGIFQVNINPGNIGNTDPAALVISGSRSSESGVQGYVFETPDGWGFEAALPLPFTPAHGQEIGFQAQANGSSGGDRDVKLIWSNDDDTDSSWDDPSLFGSALFFEIGRDDVPQPSVYVEPPPEQFLIVNQTGYFPGQVKYAVFPQADAVGHRLAWRLIDTETGESVFGGLTQPGVFDEASGDYVNLIDFSAFDTPGTYLLDVDGIDSAPFTIGTDIYAPLAQDALAYFYHNRSGIPIETQYAGGEQWARPAGHITDAEVTCYQGKDTSGITWDGCDYTLDASHGWYDAGDYGKYVVNGGISAWTLMNLYEFAPAAFGDGALTIPEAGNGVPDILDEARWEMDFMLGMQVPPGEPQAGMAHHKLHSLVWDPLPIAPATEWDNNSPTNGRYVMPPSTAATLNLAATAAQCARLWEPFDTEYAARCLTAAETAWQAALDNPIFLYGDIPGNGGGAYGDSSVDDEFFWAAAELYTTTGDAVYLDFLHASPYFARLIDWSPGDGSAIWWGGTALLGKLTLAQVSSDLSPDDQASQREQVIAIADNYLDVVANQGYRVPTPTDTYVWGSNSGALNNALVMAYAYAFTGEQAYLDGVIQTMDYILGRNALNFSFVSGYGARAMAHPHHRFWADEPSAGYPPVPPGALAGGPNATPSDPPAQKPDILARAPAKRYIDDQGSYSTNEVAINWNAPLAWVATFLDQALGE